MANIKISELPEVSGPILADDILLLVRGGVTYRIDGDEHGIAGVSSFNTRTGDITLSQSDITTALTYSPVEQNSSNNIVYGTNASGQQVVITYSRSSTPAAVAQRTSVGTLQALTVADTHPQATANDLTNRAYVQDVRTDRITSVSSAIVSYTIASDVDGIIVTGADVTNLTITLPSSLSKYKRVLIKFTASVANLVIDPGTDISDVANTIDYSPTSATAGDLFEWGYDISTSKWLITNYLSFSSLP